MKLENHPAIRESWSVLCWASSGGGPFDEIASLNSVLKKVIRKRERRPHEDHIELTRDGDDAVASLSCDDPSLLENLLHTLSNCVGKTVREVGQCQVRDDLTLVPQAKVKG